jgi:hypothetical protein
MVTLEDDVAYERWLLSCRHDHGTVTGELVLPTLGLVSVPGEACRYCATFIVRPSVPFTGLLTYMRGEPEPEPPPAPPDHEERALSPASWWRRWLGRRP